MKPTDCICFKLAKASQTAIRFWSQKVANLNITVVQAMILRFLHEQDQITSRELGERTMLDSATLTGVIDRLESVGHVRREHNPKDRRSILIRLTAKGREVGERLDGLMEEANREFLSEFTGEEGAALRDYLDRIRTRDD
ncbi:MAG: MarR family transcriptional regulator [Deltaproteobacteria bacterium]|uniref:MarR family transcriptional regulator n=1 Tax=Candidatus Zymogenus saltonus TaxID=2844893 RepID=A0A9D8KGA8_9DELT|nr:MarR family transcriptional regulator [Candidatus Zymogenus saltonus]